MCTRLAELPVAYAPFLSALRDPLARDLTLRTHEWAIEHGVLAASGLRVPEAVVVVACVYAHLCAPRFPSVRCSDVAARFTTVFLFIDDAPTADLATLIADPTEWSAGPLTDGLRAWLESLPELQTCPRSLRATFTASFHDYVRARRREPEVAHGELAVDDHWRIRRQTIFMDPYVEQWMISTAIDTDDFDMTAFAEARRLATDIVLLSNDLGSVARDRKDGESPEDLNLIATYERVYGLSTDEAVERLIDHHNHLVASYRDAVESTRVAQASTHADAYAELLTGVVGGNLDTLWTLDFRYRDVAHILKRLERVTEPRR